MLQLHCFLDLCTKLIVAFKKKKVHVYVTCQYVQNQFRYQCHKININIFCIEAVKTAFDSNMIPVEEDAILLKKKLNIAKITSRWEDMLEYIVY